MSRFRPGRVRQLRAWFPHVDGTGRILDVGGTVAWWKIVQPGNRDITVVNLDSRQEKPAIEAGYSFNLADACALPYDDNEFDLVFSNSVIEHVGGWDDQRRFAHEVLRCGQSVYVQTPNLWFPVEPHLIAPVLHWLPRFFERRLIRWCSVWGWVTKPSQSQIDRFIDNTRLLSRREMLILFPGCEVMTEKFLFITKSHIAIRRGEAQCDTST